MRHLVLGDQFPQHAALDGVKPSTAAVRRSLATQGRHDRVQRGLKRIRERPPVVEAGVKGWYLAQPIGIGRSSAVPAIGYGVAEEIPLADGSVDAAAVGQAFHWFDGDRALAEIHRVTRPRGRLAV
ncbi:MAG: methyltransferase domain-containing protein [Solirubrobacteraceae bacterium]